MYQGSEGHLQKLNISDQSSVLYVIQIAHINHNPYLLNGDSWCRIFKHSCQLIMGSTQSTAGQATCY